MEEHTSQELHRLEARVNEASGFFEKAMVEYVLRFEESSATAVKAIEKHNRGNQSSISEVRDRLQTVEDFCAAMDRTSRSAGTGMQDSSRFNQSGCEKLSDWSVMSTAREHLEETLTQELERLAHRQDDMAASLRKHMEATIDTNHKVSSMVMEQVEELKGRVEKDTLHMMDLEEKLTLELQRISKMQQDHGDGLLQQLRCFEDTNQQVNSRLLDLEKQCVSIDVRLLEQGDRVTDMIEKAPTAALGRERGNCEGAAATLIDNRLKELEHRADTIVPADDINKMFAYEREQHETSLKHLLASVIADNLSALKDLDNKVSQRFEDDASERSNLEQQIVASLADRIEKLTSHTRSFVGKLAHQAAQQETTVSGVQPASMRSGDGVESSASLAGTIETLAPSDIAAMYGSEPQSHATATPGTSFRQGFWPSVPPTRLANGSLASVVPPPRSPPQSPGHSSEGSPNARGCRRLCRCGPQRTRPPPPWMYCDQ